MASHLSAARKAEEASFAKRYLDSLASHEVTYTDDHVPPPEKRPRRMPVVGVSDKHAMIGRDGVRTNFGDDSLAGRSR
jgi:hypothetical protein